jgi:hypothetical protein
MVTKNEGIMLIKFHENRYINPFYEEGLIYMNTLPYFQQIKDKQIRGDKCENLTSVLQPNKVKVLINGIEITDIISPITIYNSPDDLNKFTHVFSMVSLCNGDRTRKDNKIFDERVRNFGDMLVVIFNLKEFFNRLVKKLNYFKKNGDILSFKMDRVFYININNYHGQMTAFHKVNEYSWQQEWRLAITAINVNNPFQFEIGNIADISKKMDVKDFKNEISIIDGTQRVNF